jgi:DNA repair exonuclease SbcCD nuclease subunit
MKASSVTAPKGKQAKEKPDLEEAIDESDDGELVEEVKDEEEDVDLSKDKYVKQPKKKAAPRREGRRRRMTMTRWRMTKMKRMLNRRARPRPRLYPRERRSELADDGGVTRRELSV